MDMYPRESFVEQLSEVPRYAQMSFDDGLA